MCIRDSNYCYQTSKKIRQVFDYKRRNGQYIGAFAPYGYVKHPKDKHRPVSYTHLRQAFLPGEVTAEEANRIGYETAMRWTKGKHQFLSLIHI